MMARLPAVCTRCGNYFNTGIEITDGNAVMMNCGTNCPRCGGDATILDGEYSAVADALGMALRKPLTAMHFADFYSFMRRLETERDADPDGGIPQDFVDAATALNPALGAGLKFLKEKKLGWGAALLFAAALQAQCSGISIDNSTHINIDRSTKVENTALYYPHKPTKREDEGYD